MCALHTFPSPLSAHPRPHLAKSHVRVIAFDPQDCSQDSPNTNPNDDANNHLYHMSCIRCACYVIFFSCPLSLKLPKVNTQIPNIQTCPLSVVAEISEIRYLHSNRSRQLDVENCFYREKSRKHQNGARFSDVGSAGHTTVVVRGVECVSKTSSQYTL